MLDRGLPAALGWLAGWLGLVSVSLSLTAFRLFWLAGWAGQVALPCGACGASCRHMVYLPLITGQAVRKVDPNGALWSR